MDELATLDREAFAQVWSRVSAGREGPVEAAAPSPAPQEAEEEARRARELVLALLSDASVYRDLTRRTRRATGELSELRDRKVRQAKRLAAAYFLMTGVRYWPKEATPVNPPEGFFPALRERFLAEGRLCGELEGLSAASTDRDMGQLWDDLARETREMTRAIRMIVERES